MEFCLVLGHGIPWNSMEHFPCISMELHELKSIEFHVILSGIGTWISMELYGILSRLVVDGIPWK